MSNQQFVYDESLLVSCATSNVVVAAVAAVASATKNQKKENENDHNDDEHANSSRSSSSRIGDIPRTHSCSILWEQHAKHYNYYDKVYDDKDDDEDGPFGHYPVPRRFLESVRMVYQHNTRPSASSSSSLYRIKLNQFAHVQNPFLTMKQPPQPQHQEEEEEEEEEWNQLWKDETWKHQQDTTKNGISFLRLYNDESIQNAIALTLYHPHPHHLNQDDTTNKRRKRKLRHHHHHHHHDGKHYFHDSKSSQRHDAPPPPPPSPLTTFVTPLDTTYAHLEIAPDNDFAITPNNGITTTTNTTRHHHHHHHHHHDYFYSNTNIDEQQQQQQQEEKDVLWFRTNLNWADTNNPDGVSVVHPPLDQGACGSCWAFAATGTVEASASRRIAFTTYMNAITHNLLLLNNNNNENDHHHHHHDDDDEDDASSFITKKKKKMKKKDQMERNAQAVMVAQMAERQAMVIADLSVQELVDCDTMADQGCTGGNPLLAFYFIHRYGLTSTQAYPYLGKQQEMCQVQLVANPIASVESWGILTSNHEDNMEHVIRNLGPIAVGFNGADPKFLAYSGGIFDSDDCEQGANHALLIVGYGQQQQMDPDDERTIIKYWIARNSWGKGWGENGYVRVKRNSGVKGVPGVCGIAKSPSVALGGTLLHFDSSSGIQSTTTTTTTTTMTTNSTQYDPSQDEKSERMETNSVSNYCDTIGLENLSICNRLEGFMDSHPAMFCFVVSFFVVAMVAWPLTKECRMHRRERRKRRLQRQRQQHQQQQHVRPMREKAERDDNLNSDESSLLLFGTEDADYGTSSLTKSSRVRLALKK